MLISKANMPQTIISSKNQITLPKRILEELGLKAGAKLIIRPKDHQIILEARPKSLTQALKGLGKNAFKKLGGGEAYLKREKAQWK
ncbi:MAG: AbrB/MazE/SpoVT family DNA-binding domain-containing protein [Candidatus Brennerbacteria bacterium]|nr:AbrB/MazE/SpoVT family DNA-binding domain-containing protein [Candidatus Brennerbacteria bacterium]